MMTSKIREIRVCVFDNITTAVNRFLFQLLLLLLFTIGIYNNNSNNNNN